MVEVYSFNDFSIYTTESNYSLYKEDVRVEMVDNEGYKYFFRKYNIGNIRKRKTIPARFFDLNPYTEDNIRLHLQRVSKGNVTLEDFKDAKNAHDPLLLYNKAQELHYTKSWNEISNGNYYLKTRNDDYIPSRRLSKQIVKNYLDSYGLIMVGEYKNNITPIEFICKKHKDKGVQRMNWATMQRSPCPCRYCKKGNWSPAKTDEEFKKEVECTKSSKIEIVGTYCGVKNKIECRCKKCGRTIYLRPDHIRRGIGCGQCTKSIGEDRVEQFLKNHNIEYEREYRFKDCVRVQRPLPFDFYIPSMNILIEFDGVQHFQRIGRFGDEDNFAELKLNDEFKNNYCREHGITLIRISYKDIDRVDELLSAKLSDL